MAIGAGVSTGQVRSGSVRFGRILNLVRFGQVQAELGPNLTAIPSDKGRAGLFIVSSKPCMVSRHSVDNSSVIVGKRYNGNGDSGGEAHRITQRRRADSTVSGVLAHHPPSIRHGPFDDCH